MKIVQLHCAARPARMAALILATTIVCGLAGCATYERCGFKGCPGDASITAAIEADLRANAAIADWEIRVQTLDHVVYLYGIVDTNVQRSFIVATAKEAPGVTRVVDSIVIRGDAW